MMDTQEEVNRYADSVRDDVREVAAWLSDPDGFKHPDGKEYGRGADALYDYLAEWPLEVVLEPGEPFHVTLSVGGPNIFLVGDSFGGERIEVHWGGKSATRYGGDALAAVLDWYREGAES